MGGIDIRSSESSTLLLIALDLPQPDDLRESLQVSQITRIAAVPGRWPATVEVTQAVLRRKNALGRTVGPAAEGAANSVLSPGGQYMTTVMSAVSNVLGLIRTTVSSK